MNKTIVAQVIINRPLRGLDRVFTYAIPENLIEVIVPGSRVVVPFGRQKVTGCVLATGDEASPNIDLKEILSLDEETPSVPPVLIKLARWIASRYLCTYREALSVLYGPVGNKTRRDQHCLWPEGDASVILTQLESLKAPAQVRALNVIAAHPGIARPVLLREAGVGAATLNTLIKKGYVTTTTVPLSETPYGKVAVDDSKPPVLNPEQQSAFEEVLRSIRNREQRVFLIHGVTGSGKTEIYLHAAAAALASGTQSIILVPEIALAHQMVLHFKSRFGNKVAVIHSNMSRQQRHNEWERVQSGKAQIVLGARSAIFAPTGNLGLIVVDEEHEPAYKQEQAPRYHAREVAVARGALEKAVVVLGSATPALESYARTLNNRYRCLALPNRIDGCKLPDIKVVDLREEFRVGNPSVLSRMLAERISQKLRKKEQVLLFLNRRGFASFVLCRTCGNIIRCPNCDIALTYHQPETLLCHYCHHRTRHPGRCPVCDSRLEQFGSGTQRVEEEVRGFYPNARVLRMDAETTARRGSHASILDAFMARDVDILIGTQMVAKGLDIPGVTLVGVINADTSLLLPDFRAAERTFQLLYQVAGRAGRGELPGEVVIQSHCPEHYAVQLSSRQDYSAFARKELDFRRRFGYPPYTSLLRVLVSGLSEDAVVSQAGEFASLAKSTTEGEFVVLGPAPCPFSKLKGRYRWHIILKGKRGEALRRICRDVLEGMTPHKNIKLTVDVDPQSLV
ncbi:MAG: primosomal protein N' [Bacillota bacterium]